MPSACALLATSEPIMPRPIMPNVLPKSSKPGARFQSLFRAAVATCGIFRASANISPSVNSATETRLAELAGTSGGQVPPEEGELPVVWPVSATEIRLAELAGTRGKQVPPEEGDSPWCGRFRQPKRGWPKHRAPGLEIHPEWSGPSAGDWGDRNAAGRSPAHQGHRLSPEELGGPWKGDWDSRNAAGRNTAHHGTHDSSGGLGTY